MSVGGGFPTHLFFRNEYVSAAVEQGMRHTFDVRKARRVRDALVAAGAARPGDFIAPAAVTPEELRLVHTDAYLEEIFRPEALASLLLVDPTQAWGDRLLRPFLFATGGTLAASRLALRKRSIAVNLGGGYHHAQSDRGEGFCPIADVAIAVRALQASRDVNRVLLVDLDCHHGNGNAVIFADDESVFTFSVHAGNWCWIEKENNLDIELASGCEDDTYLVAVRDHLPAILDRFEPDFVVYLAGSDPWVDDVLGDFRVSTAGMLARDRLVTEEVRRRGLPMAVVMAGGYGPESWRIHYRYFLWLRTGRAD